MDNFVFINNKNYKEILQRDYNEICISIENNAVKAAAVLSGSLIEALLTYFLIEKKIKSIPKTTNENTPILNKSNKQIMVKIDNAGLNNLINECRNKNYISTNVYHLLHFLRDYRNFIHPSKEIRENTEIASEPSIFKNLVDMIISEIAKKSSDDLGLTSEQLLTYIVQNEDSDELFGHLIKRARTEDDVNELIISLIPNQIKRCKEVIYSYCDYDGELSPQNQIEAIDIENNQNIINRLFKSYENIQCNISDDLKKKLVKEYIRIITNSDQIYKEIYYDLIKIEYIKNNKKDDKELILEFYIRHRLNIKKNVFYNNIVEILYIANEKQISDIIDYIIRDITNNDCEGNDAKIIKFLKILKGENISLYNKTIEEIKNMLGDSDKKYILERNILIEEIFNNLKEVVPEYRLF